MREIDADRLLEEKRIHTYYHLPNGDIAIPLIDIKNAPTIEPRCEACEAFNKTRLLIPQPERKKGKWIDRGWSGDGRGNSWHEWECSECKHITKGAKWDFCPNCGADMTEKSEEPKKCDTCKHEKEPWSMQCHRCENYNLWEAKQ